MLLADTKIKKYKIYRKELELQLTEEELDELIKHYDVEQIKTAITFRVRELQNVLPCHRYNKYVNMGPIYCVICGKKLNDTLRLKASRGCSFKCQQLDPVVKEKQIHHFQQKYNVNNAQQIPEVKIKKEHTSLKNYGVKYYFQDPVLRKNKFEKTMILKYGKQHPLQIKDIHDKQKNTNFLLYGCENSGALFNRIKSKGELEVLNFIKNNTKSNVISGDNCTIQFYQLDIYIPELKLAIEFNGDYWHSIKANKHSQKRQIRKTKDCESKGIRLIHIWEHDWKNNQEYCKYVIKCYLDGKIPDTSIYNNRLPRDYFQTLDFPDRKIEEPIVEKSGNHEVYKTGYILI